MTEEEKDIKDPEQESVPTPDAPQDSAHAPDAPQESETPNSEDTPQESEPNTEVPGKKHKRGRWLRVTLRVLLAIIIFILLIPVLLYVPPVQTFVKNTACSIVKKSTGMDIQIDKFRLKWPVDISLQGVTIIEATGDTMVNAKEIIADVKLRPLLRLDFQINKLDLIDGYYRMLSPDSSMLLRLNAGLLTVDDKSAADMRDSRIVLNKALLRDGRVSLFMNVWKQQAKSDTTSTPFFIAANDLTLENFTFAMSMLPTIDTLTLNAGLLKIRNGIVDLGKNEITADYLGASKGKAVYLTPTPEYIAEHPAPAPDTTAVASPPMIIKGDTVSLTDFSAIYAVKDAKPLPGFDPSYIEVSDVNVSLLNFYNASSTLELPIKSITAKERSGLQITEGHGTVAIDSAGLALRELYVATPYSTLSATAGLPFALMALEPSAPVNVKGEGHIGIPDIDAFMPDMAVYTKKLPQRAPLNLDLTAEGRLDNVDIPRLALDMPGVFSLNANGRAADALDFKKLRANLDFNGSIVNPSVVDGILGNIGFKMPRLTLKGHATADHETYGANFKLLTSVGDVAANGRVSMTAETYDARVSLNKVNVAHFMPTSGVGRVSADLRAKGVRFNPERPRAATDIHLDIASLVYEKQTLRNIIADIQLHNGLYTLQAVSNNAFADFNIEGSGTVGPDLYTFDVQGDLTHLDLHSLGLSPDRNEGGGRVLIKGTASPAKWNYDVDLTLDAIKWYVADAVYDIPGPVDAKFVSGPTSVNASVDALLTSLRFDSPMGLKSLMSRFTLTSDTLNRQLKNKFINIDNIQAALPPFNLGFRASGRGTLGKILNTIGLAADTIYASFANDSLLYGDAGVRSLTNGSMRADTLTLNLSQRKDMGLIDYKVHMGNRRNNPIADFADVNVNGYLGANRLLLSLTQKNQKGKTGYRLGMTASYTDSVAIVHFTPLKATIAYLPWQFNQDNHVEYNVISHRISADLKANSNESSILLQTQNGRNGNDELHLVLDNIHIQDFLQMSLFAPPLTASVNADLKVGYTNSWFYGGGSVGVRDFTYDRQRVGDFDLGLRAGYNNDGTTAALATLTVDGDSALNAKMRFAPDSTGVLETKRFDLQLTRFPLRVANAFLGRDVASLSGYLNGDLGMKGTLTAPILNGRLDCDSVGVYVPMIGSTLSFGTDSILVADNVVKFNQFDVWGANKNPLVLDGSVDARKLSNILFNLGLDGRDVQLIGNNSNARSDIYGKLFVDMHANVTGSMQAMNVNADLRILKATDLTYSISETAAQLNQLQDASGVVKFVNFNDTTMILKEDTVAPMMAMRIVAGLTIDPGTRVTVDIPGSAVTGSGRVQVQPEGTLNYFQNYMGDMRLNGQLNLQEGTVRYGVAMGAVKADFNLNPSSYIHWNGDLMNPILNISATDPVKANLIEDGNSRLVNFLVQLNVTNNLEAPKVTFDLSTDDDMAVQNDLLSMSADQRSMAAINLLLTGQYSAGGAKTASSDLIDGMQGRLYGLLASQLNSFLASHVKGVDISLGVDQYDKMVNGQSGTTTSYSYTMSKSLFDDRFKISVGGNYSTDASADENFSENLISDISFEYILRQTSNLTMYARLFRHTGYESILEGEITETGVGFVMKRRLERLWNLFNFLPGRKRDEQPALAPPAGGVPGMPGMPGVPTRSAAPVDSIKTEQNDTIR